MKFYRRKSLKSALWKISILAFLSLLLIDFVKKSYFHQSFFDNLVDNSTAESFLQKLARLEDKTLHYMPLTFLHKKAGSHYENVSCSWMPTVEQLHISNTYWQELSTSNGTLYLYGAYYDVRQYNALGPTIRYLVMIDRYRPTLDLTCLLWYPHKRTPVRAKLFSYKYIWFRDWGNTKPGNVQPYLLSFPIPEDYHGQIPEAVSLVEHHCDSPRNALKVIYNPLPRTESAKKRVAVCVKGLDFPKDEMATKIVQWIEIIRILGADKIFFYELQVSSKLRQVLDYYQDQGFIDVRPISLPGWQPSLPMLQHNFLKKNIIAKRQNEVIPYNDCLYRNIYTHDFIALLDVDEIIVPKTARSWSEMLGQFDKDIADYNFQNMYYLASMQPKNLDLDDLSSIPEIPEHLHMLRHVYRSNKTSLHIKSFHNTNYVLTLHNHYPLECLTGQCPNQLVNNSIAQMHHYRDDCTSDLKHVCEEKYKNHSVLDPSLWRFKDSIIKQVDIAMNTLKLKP